MLIPTAAELRADTRIDWSALFRLTTDDLLDEQAALAWVVLEEMTGQDFASIESKLEPIVRAAVKLMIAALNVDIVGGFESLTAMIAGPITSFSVPGYCVPMDAEALSRRGWRTYADLCVDDEIMGYDMESGKLRWTRIRDFVTPHYAETVRVGGAHWGFRATPNHRVVVGRGGEWDLVEAGSMPRQHKLLLSAEADLECSLDITPAEAGLVSWLYTDGHIRRPAEYERFERGHYDECLYCGRDITGLPGRGIRMFCRECGPKRRSETVRNFEGSIYQKHYTEAVESTLALCEATYSKNLRDTGFEYILSSPWLRDLWERAGLNDSTLPEFVLKLGTDHLEAFLSAGLLAEGSHATASRARAPISDCGPWYRWQFAQNKGEVLDAYVLAASLRGYQARLWNTQKKLSGFICGKPEVDTHHAKVTAPDLEMVWCPTTETGTWLMRQGNLVAITGNSESRSGPSSSSSVSQSAKKWFHEWGPLDKLIWLLATPEKRDEAVALATGKNPISVGFTDTFDLPPLFGIERELL